MALARTLLELSRRKHHVIGLSALRFVAGATLLFEYLHVYQERFYLFGPRGVSPFEYVSNSLFALSNDPLYFDVLFHLAILSAFFWMLGCCTRIVTPIALILWWSLQQTNPGLWDGGHNLSLLVMFYGCFAELDHHWSITSRETADVSGFSLTSRLATLTHNAAVLAIAIQVSILYTVAGAMKMAGETWRNGTALYYALHPAEFYLPGISEVLWSSREALTVAAYCTMYLQLAFPLLLFLNKHSRRVAIALILCFHLGILFVMGLVTFALFMIAVDLCLIDDQEYRAIGVWLRRSVERLRRLASKQQPWRRRYYETT